MRHQHTTWLDDSGDKGIRALAKKNTRSIAGEIAVAVQEHLKNSKTKKDQTR